MLATWRSAFEALSLKGLRALDSIRAKVPPEQGPGNRHSKFPISADDFSSSSAPCSMTTAKRRYRSEPRHHRVQRYRKDQPVRRQRSTRRRYQHLSAAEIGYFDRQATSSTPVSLRSRLCRMVASTAWANKYRNWHPRLYGNRTARPDKGRWRSLGYSLLAATREDAA